jgi:tetraacyldisaccharide 4'-kinase
LGALLPLKDWWLGNTNAAISVHQVPRQGLLAAAGIGHPEKFFRMLADLGLQFERLPLPDHAPLEPRPWPANTACIIVTEKDAVKLLPADADADRILVAALDLALPSAVVDAVERWLRDPLKN